MPQAATLTSFHSCPLVTPGIPPIPHLGGPITDGKTSVLIGGLPAATVGCSCACIGTPDVVIKGSKKVLINGLPAARVGDKTAHGGTILTGCNNVIIG